MDRSFTSRTATFEFVWDTQVPIPMKGAGRGLPLKIRMFVYLSHALSTWGDRMWSFGVGLFMVIISPDSLRLTAAYGLSMGGAVLLFGALVGDWIDKTPRLRAARISLLVQNLSVIICALIVYTVITYKTQIQAVWPDEGLLLVCYVGIILVAIFSMLGSMGTSIAVQKDWIVEICDGDNDVLATMSATLRRIDLCNKLLAPIATGQIMYFASPGIGALFIAGWNLVSVFVEYILLWKVYSLVPALRRAKKEEPDVSEEEAAQEMVTFDSGSKHGDDLESEGQGQDPVTSSDKADEKSELNGTNAETVNGVDESLDEAKGRKEKSKYSVVLKMFSGFITLYRGWKTYMRYEVAFAGMGLAALYMTVLGFDNVTVGYAYTQGINESVMGIVMAVSAIMGIVGTFLYPVIRKRIGLERTGLFGFFFEVSFLCLCVASIWAPGSPFDPFFRGRERLSKWNLENNVSKDNVTISLNGTSANVSYNVTDLGVNTTLGVNDSYKNVTGDNPEVNPLTIAPAPQSPVSVWLLLAGIVGARCGLWMADLTITQLFLEHVKVTERGIVNGVQTSLNKLMDMLKFVMVIAAPEPELFGILILISFAFIILGWISYAKYSRGIRGHLFHFDKIKKCNFQPANVNGTHDNTGDS